MLRIDLNELLQKTEGKLTSLPREKVRDFLLKYASEFAERYLDLAETADLSSSSPEEYKRHITEEMSKIIDDILAKGVIKPSSSPWSSPIVLVKMKDGSYRICEDYTRLNSCTIPRIDEFLDQLSGST